MLQQAMAIRARLKDESRVYGGVAEEPDQKKKGALVGAMNKAFGSDENRKLALSWLFIGVPRIEFSSKQLKNGEWYALEKWIGSWRDDSGVWHVSETLYRDAVIIVRAALAEYAAIIFGVSSDGVVASTATLDGYKVIEEVENEE